MKTKKLICLLLMMCMMFFGGTSAMAGYEVGDKIEGYEITYVTHTDLNWTHYLLIGETMYIFNSDDIYVEPTGTVGKYKLLRTDCCYAKCSIDTDEMTISFREYSQVSQSGTLNTSFSLSDVKASNFNLCDSNGNVVFPPPPEVVSGLGAITTELLMTVLLELKPILLGLAVSVIGFLAFRKAWNWVLANCRAG